MVRLCRRCHHDAEDDCSEDEPGAPGVGDAEEAEAVGKGVNTVNFGGGVDPEPPLGGPPIDGPPIDAPPIGGPPIGGPPIALGGAEPNMFSGPRDGGAMSAASGSAAREGGAINAASGSYASGSLLAAAPFSWLPPTLAGADIAVGGGANGLISSFSWPGNTHMFLSLSKYASICSPRSASFLPPPPKPNQLRKPPPDLPGDFSLAGCLLGCEGVGDFCPPAGCCAG